MQIKKCKACAKKHLCAALAYTEHSPEDTFPHFIADETCVNLISRAWVLLGESPFYPSHYYLAIGCLVKAEEIAMLVTPSVAPMIREARLMESADAIMTKLSMLGLCLPFVGHLIEAQNEGDIKLPESVSAKWFVENFESIIKPLLVEETTERKGGEKTMAKKVPAKKGFPMKKEEAPAKKGAKACSKGGKAACKGGKTCKK